MDQAIAMTLKEKTKVSPKNCCTYCESTRHKVADCRDFQNVYMRPKFQQSVRQPLPPRSPPHPLSDQIEGDKSEDERFDSYDMCYNPTFTGKVIPELRGRLPHMLGALRCCWVHT